MQSQGWLNELYKLMENRNDSWTMSDWTSFIEDNFVSKLELLRAIEELKFPEYSKSSTGFEVKSHLSQSQKSVNDSLNKIKNKLIT